MSQDDLVKKKRSKGHSKQDNDKPTLFKPTAYKQDTSVPKKSVGAYGTRQSQQPSRGSKLIRQQNSLQDIIVLQAIMGKPKGEQ